MKCAIIFVEGKLIFVVSKDPGAEVGSLVFKSIRDGLKDHSMKHQLPS